MNRMTILRTLTGLLAGSMLIVSSPAVSSPLFHKEIRGSLLMDGCRAQPSFLVNGRSVSPSHLRLNRIRGGYAYRLKLGLMDAVRPVTIRPMVPSYLCRGRWSPAVRTYRPSRSRWERPLNFRFIGRTVRSTSMRVIRIPVSVITRVLDRTFSGMKIRINNYSGRRRGNSWYKPNDSWVQLPRALGGSKIVFRIPEYVKGVFRYYINSVNLKRVWFDRDGRHLRMNLKFESRGTEIKGRCAGSGIKCFVGDDKAAPDIQMNGTTVTISMKPIVTRDRRSITYGDLHVRFRARIQGQGICRGIVDLCNVLTRYKREIPRQVERGIYRSLNNNALRQQVANALRRSVLRNVGRILSVSISGNNFVLRVERASR